MSIYLVESMLLSLIGVSWITAQSLIYSTSLLDTVIIYTQFWMTMFLLIISLYFTEESHHKDIHRCFFCVHFAMAVYYVYMMEQFFAFTDVSVAPIVLCPNITYSRSYQLFYLQKSPAMLTTAFCSVTVGLLWVQALVSAIANKGTNMLSDCAWIDIFLVLICVTHILLYSNEASTIMYWALIIIMSGYFLLRLLVVAVILVIGSDPGNAFLEAVLKLFGTMVMEAMLYLCVMIYSGYSLLWAPIAVYSLTVVLLASELRVTYQAYVDYEPPAQNTLPTIPVSIRLPPSDSSIQQKKDP